MDASTCRRRFLLDPGEPLLLPAPALDIALRNSEFRRRSRLRPGDVLCLNQLAAPLPRYDADGALAARQAVNVRMLWHPLFWLPPEIAGRYSLTFDDSSASIESDDVWGLRLALQLTVSGLYDVATGGWTDVLAPHGIDVDDDGDLQRLRAWRSGDPDEVLDRIDLADHFAVEDADPDWAIQSALALEPDVTRGSTAMLADDLLDALDAAEPEDLASILLLGEALLGDDTGLGRSYWARHLTAAATADAAGAATVAASVRDALRAIRDELWPHVDALQEPRQGGRPLVTSGSRP